MARNIKLANVKDFRGGVNLRGDGFELSDDESPDILNMDIDARGGLQSRRGITLQPVASWGNPNLLTPDQSIAKTVQDNTALTFSNCSSVRQTGTGMPALNGRPTPTTWRRFTVPAAAQAYMTFSNTVLPNERINLGGAFKSVSGSLHQVTVRLDWYVSNGGAYISSNTGAATVLTTAWQHVGLTGVQAPSNATWCIAIWWVGYTAPSAGSVVDLGNAFFSRGSYNDKWFDQTILELPGEITSWGRYVRSGVDQLYAVAGSVMIYCTASAPTVWYVMMNWSADGWFVQFKDQFYFGELNQFTRQTDAYTVIQLADGYNDNLALPSANYGAASRFPIMRCPPVVWNGLVVCVPGQDPAGTIVENRIRWSHPNSANDWRSFDYIDVDTGVDGDTIKAIVPFGDRLLIFKKHSVYALTGTSPDTFQVFPISRRVGAVDNRAIALTEGGVYFYDEREGVFVFDGKSLRWQFERIHPLITEEKIARSQVTRVRLGWSGRRLWVAVPWRVDRGTTAPVNNTRVFVLDPTLSKEGSWTQYDCGAVGTMYELVVAGQAVRLLGARAYLGRFYVLEDPGTAPPVTDLVSVGGVDVAQHITSYYVTQWFDLDQPAISKRWRHPEFVVRSVNADSSLEVEVRKDFDSRIAKRRFTLITTPDQAEMLWGDPWGEVWSGATTTSPASVILRGPTLGKAKAVQLKVNGPPTNHHWGLNTIALKYTPLPPRS